MIREQNGLQKVTTESQEHTSAAMPWSGFAALRTGWEQDDPWALMDTAPWKSTSHEDKLSVLTNGKFQRVEIMLMMSQR